MRDAPSNVSRSYQAFLTEAPAQAAAWGEAIEKLAAASALEPKTQALAYLAVLAALRLESGIAFHAAQARALGATREEIVSALLVGLPAAGVGVTAALAAALGALADDHG